MRMRTWMMIGAAAAGIYYWIKKNQASVADTTVEEAPTVA